MAKLVCRVFKMILFFGLFLFSIRYIYHPLSLVSSWNQHYVFVVSEFLDIHDIKFFDMIFCVAVNLITSEMIYIPLMKFIRYCCVKRKNVATP
jgi:hypothetical protein